jgi:hypothetical protein
MASGKQKLPVPLSAHREPPEVSADGQAVYRALVDPITTILSFRPDDARRAHYTLLAAWRDVLRLSEVAANETLRSLHGSAQRTWRVGQKIVGAIAPVYAALWSAARELYQATLIQNCPETTANAYREHVAETLSAFDADADPLLDELAAAVKADFPVQPDAPTNSTGTPRLSFDCETQTAILDGERYKIENPKAFFLYKAIAERKGQPITRTELRQQNKGLKGDKTIPNLRVQWPAKLQETILSGPSGYWLSLPAK